MSRVLVIRRVARVAVLQPDPLVVTVETAPQGPSGPPGADGPSRISDATALGSLSSVTTDAQFLLAANAAGTFARRLFPGTAGKSLLLAANALAGRSVLGLANVSSSASNLTGDVYLGGVSNTEPLALNLWNAALETYDALQLDDGGWTFPRNASFNGAVSAPSFVGDGSQLTNLPAGTAAAGTLTGTTLAPNVVASSLTSVGALTSLAIASGGAITRAVPVSPTLTDYYTDVVSLSNGNLCFRVRTRYDPSGVDSRVTLQFYNPKTGTLFGQMGVEDGTAGFVTASRLQVNDVFTANAGLQVGSYADALFSGPIRSYAGRGVQVYPQPTYGTVVNASNVPTPNILPPVASTAALRLYTHTTTTGHLELVQDSSVGSPKVQAVVNAVWADSTDATRAGRLTLSAYSTTTAQEGVRVDGNPAGVRLGFFGGSATAKPTGVAVTAAGIHAALVSLGLIAA